MRLKQIVFAHVETWRPYTACYVGLVGLAGAALTDPHASTLRLLCAWAVPTVGWLAGLYGGDYFDRKLDATAKPHRPIPSGRMRAGTALAMLIGLTAAGGVIGLAVNWRTIGLVLIALLLGIAYSAFFKGRGLAGNAVRGLISAFACLFGAMTVADLPPVTVLPLAAAFWLHDTGSNLVGALRDVDGDRAGGYETLPVRRGMAVGARVATSAILVAYLFAVLQVVVSTEVTAAAFVVFALAVVTAMAAIVPLWTDEVTRLRAYRAHTVLVIERVLLAGAFVTLGFGFAVGIPVTALALCCASVSQRVLRARHELTGEERAETVGADTVLAFVDSQVAELAARPAGLRALTGWERLIEVRLSEPDLVIVLSTAGGTVRRLTGVEPELPRLTITTTGAVFAAIFLHGTSNPRRAYLTRALRMQAPPRDMMLLNQLFNEFRGHTGRVTTAPREPLPTGELPERVVISDTTLRDGEQMPGVAFSPAQKLDLARQLVALGIPLIEVGFPVVSEEESAAIRAIVDADLDAVIQVIARPADADVDAALHAGAHSVAVFIGTSESHLRHKLRIDVDELKRRVDRAVRRVKAAGRQAVFAAEDATRTDPDVLVAVYDAAAEAGADALGLADTAGVAQPWTMRELVEKVGASCPLPLAVHCHNDLGLATANSLAGLLGGASGVQCSVLGIGERAGNAPLEQVVMALEAAMGHSTGLELPLLEPLARHVAGLIGGRVPPYAPVVGAHAFVHESGLHVDGISRDPSTYEPYSPELVGRQRQIVLGKHSGRSAVVAVAAECGLTVDTADVDAVLAEIKRGSVDTDRVAELLTHARGSGAGQLWPVRGCPG
ncbi:UbiA family prenyltransferase [Kibdelosporangium aridum]|uniref:Isopropylmalate/homocitrate/citramalate synthases n=1 Tax=Kibdelosporangium aridum TaxID=2030 RepID=A0A1W2E5F0_KIBAR|nr:UbiA family prenyltransferase [Kibdelosporangium aridum]SMD04970.1 Isopropylmalate/homocitrate/citramalate synthases [Kibdelosporangium aridum]